MIKISCKSDRAHHVPSQVSQVGPWFELNTHATLDMSNSDNCWSFTKASSICESQVFDLTNTKDFQQWRAPKPVHSYNMSRTRYWHFVKHNNRRSLDYFIVSESTTIARFRTSQPLKTDSGSRSATQNQIRKVLHGSPSENPSAVKVQGNPPESPRLTYEYWLLSFSERSFIFQMAEALPTPRASHELKPTYDMYIALPRPGKHYQEKIWAIFFGTGNFIGLVNRQYDFIQNPSVDEVVNFQANLSSFNHELSGACRTHSATSFLVH